jgi:hypothetical protein
MAHLEQDGGFVQTMCTTNVACGGFRGIQQVRRARSSARIAGRTHGKMQPLKHYAKNKQTDCVEDVIKYHSIHQRSQFPSEEKNEGMEQPLAKLWSVQPLPSSAQNIHAMFHSKEEEHSMQRPLAKIWSMHPLPSSVMQDIHAMFPSKSKDQAETPSKAEMATPPVASADTNESGAVSRPTFFNAKPSVMTWMRKPRQAGTPSKAEMSTPAVASADTNESVADSRPTFFNAKPSVMTWMRKPRPTV